jgi:cobalt/nickel transport system permease protein
VHHVVLDRWSRGRSLVHLRDARVKILVLLAYLVALGTAPRVTPAACACYAAVLIVAAASARLPLASVAARAAAVLPFALTFAAFSMAAGEPEPAAALLVKSYLSAVAVLLLAATTPLPKLLRALESLGVPRFLTLVLQFLYRYLFVISEQAQHMRLAALSRGSQSRRWRGIGDRFRAAAGAVATLFARSYSRAEGIYSAMCARGYEGRIALATPAHAGWADVLFLCAGLLAAAALRIAAGALS